MNEAEKQLDMQAALQRLAAIIGDVITGYFGQMGFALLVFDFHQPGIGNYVSNAEKPGHRRSKGPRLD